MGGRSSADLKGGKFGWIFYREHRGEGLGEVRRISSEVALLVAKMGGRYLVRGGDLRHVEGNLPLRRLVILEFPSLEAAQSFYDSPEYQPIRKIRLDSTNSDVVLVAGYSG
jgi:uncharacterized protein (DUF1330 family)